MLIAAAGHWAFHWIWHPLSYWGYQFWSGIGSDIAEYTLLTTFVAGLFAWYRRHNCHVQRCWRLQWHVHPEHGHPVCVVHHPDGHLGWIRNTINRCGPAKDHILSPDRHAYHRPLPPVSQASPDGAG